MTGKKKYKRMTIWVLETHFTLQNLPKLLASNYNKVIPYLKDKKLNAYDKMVMNRWSTYYDEEMFRMYTMEVMGLRLEYIAATAFFETASPSHKAKMMVDGKEVITPREKRIEQYSQNVFFVNLSGRVYVITIGSGHQDAKLRSALMGGGEKNHRNNGWGKIVFNKIPNYQFPSDFLYWLMGQKNTVIQTARGEIEIIEIQNPISSNKKGDNHQISVGNHLPEEGIPKTGLGTTNNIEMLGMTCSVSNEATIRVVLYENGDCFVDPYHSTVTGVKGEQTNISGHEDRIALMIYGGILPALRVAYLEVCSTGNWTAQHHDTVQKDGAAVDITG